MPMITSDLSAEDKRYQVCKSGEFGITPMNWMGMFEIHVPIYYTK